VKKKKVALAPDGALPVDVERLRKQFPALTDVELDAYVTVTRRIMSATAADRARITREILARARAAVAAAPGDAEGRLAARYLAAVTKMQGSSRMQGR
jgi:hypothetical protein